MKTLRLSMLAAVAAVVCTFHAGAQSHPRFDRPMLSASRDSLRSEIHRYFRTHVLPEMLAWKTTLDASLSSDDLASLNDLRHESRSLTDRTMNAMRAMRTAWRSEDYAALKEQREHLKSMHEQRVQLFRELKPLAEKYRETLQTLAERVKPVIVGWKADGKRIIERWRTAHADSIGGTGLPGLHRRMMRFNAMRGMMGADVDRRMAVARFMLWDGHDFTKDGPNASDSQGSADDPTGDASGFSLSQNYPNPFNPTTTIRFNLPSSAPTTVTVLDTRGNEVACLANDVLAAGEHELVFDARDLPSGTYFVRLGSGDLTRVKQMQVLK